MPNQLDRMANLKTRLEEFYKRQMDSQSYTYSYTSNTGKASMKFISKRT